MSLRHLLSRSRLLCLLLVFGYLFALIAHAEAKRFALVIGNKDYSGSFSPLINPVKDAEAIADTLTKLGFEVALYKNVSRAELRQARVEFEQRLKAQPNSVALVYFNGHGLQGSDGKNYLIPLNANIKYHEDVKEEGIAIAKMLEDINANQPQMTIFIVDACRNAVQLQSRQKGGAVKGTMNTMNGTTGSLIAFAASPDQYALDYVNNDDTHSPYTTALLANLTNPDYSIETVFKETRKQVLKNTEGKQIPTETSLLVGDFYFASPDRNPNTNTVNQPVQQAAEPIYGNDEPLYEYKPPVAADTQDRLARMEAEMTKISSEKRTGKSYFQQNCTKELTFWQENAKRNNPIAQHLLAGCYLFGKGVAQSDTEAVNWYRKAAEQGNAEGQNNLGFMYEEGKGVAQNNTEAANWYRKAAEQGDSDAKRKLAELMAKKK